MAPLVAAIPFIVAGISAASVGIAGYELANQPKAPTAPTVTGTQSAQAAAGQAAALAQANALQQRRGLASTILTSPMGVQSGPSQSSGATLGT